MESRSSLLSATAVFYFISGLLYAVGSLLLTGRLWQTRELPLIAGVPFYRGSFLAEQGLNWVIAASIAFILAGIANIVSGYWLWKSRRIGAILAIITFPIVMAIAIAGEAPVPLLVEPAKFVLVFLVWQSLH